MWGSWRSGNGRYALSLLPSSCSPPSTFGLYAPPHRDKDLDGIPDHQDLCPLLPEDFDGFEDEDGCMDPDNDNDLIPDADDMCPNETAEEGRDDDEDGCTDP